MRSACPLLLVALAVATGSTARGHELWFHLDGTGRVHLTFGDTPEPGEAERVAEIARTRAWSDGRPIDLKPLPDGLEFRTPNPQPASVLNAYADRGVVTYQGDSFIIHLAAYAQTRPLPAGAVPVLGLPDDQVRLLLVARPDQPPVVRATWKGRPVADAVVHVFRAGREPVELHTDRHGEIPAPDSGTGSAALLVQVVDPTPGQRDGQRYSEVRYKATLTIAPRP